MADDAKDLVITYATDHAGEAKYHERLQEALNNGYRVVDVIPAPIRPSGRSGVHGLMTITVVLTKDGDGLVYRRSGPASRQSSSD